MSEEATAGVAIDAGTAPHRNRISPGGIRRYGAVAVVVLAAVLAITIGGDIWIYQASLVAAYAIAAVGQQWLVGRVGQVSIGGAAFLAIGAFSGAKVAAQGWGVFPLPLIAAAVMGSAVGFIVGVAGLRFRGLYLLLSTLALQYVVAFLTFEYQGTAGGLVVPAAHIGGVTFGPGRSFLILELVVLGLVVLVLQSMYSRLPGRAWKAISEDELAAAVTSIDVVRWKLLAFMGSSAVTAMAGAILGYLLQTVSNQTFSLDLAISLLVMVFIGGVGSMFGAIIGAALVTLLPFGLQDISNSLSASASLANWLTTNGATLDNAIYGAALLVVLLFQRDGIIGLGRKLAASAAKARRTTTSKPESVDREAGARREVLATEERKPRQGAAKDTLLTIRDLTVVYPSGARGVDGLDLDVPHGSVVALLGRNGAGKTSSLRGIAGFLKSEQVSVHGTVRLAGADLSGATPMQTHRSGIVLVPERDKIFPALTVAEHLRLVGTDSQQLLLDAGFEALVSRWDSRAGFLSGGERQMLALAVAWAQKPSVLLIDELSLGLAPVITKRLLRLVRAFAEEQSISVVLVEQDATSAVEVSDYLYVIDHGRVVFEKRSDMTRADELSLTYLGSR
jgi:branched-chain amino acid transport system permease protein